MAEPILVINNLSKKYKDTDSLAVKSINLSINKAEIFGLLGPNGAGKTTLISMLSGLLKPSSGEITISGYQFRDNKKEIQHLIGIVPQEYALYPKLTAIENLNYFGAMYGIKSKELKTKIDTHLHKMGLTAFGNKKIDSFSGGMKRRINLIAGMLHNPLVLFLDEPTVGVDIQSKNVIIKQLNDINSEGTTIIYTSHHMSEAEEFCSRVAIIDNGEILVKGEPRSLINSITNAEKLEDVYLNFTGEKLRDHV